MAVDLDYVPGGIETDEYVSSGFRWKMRRSAAVAAIQWSGKGLQRAVSGCKGL
jgi:hypothetical protein